MRSLAIVVFAGSLFLPACDACSPSASPYACIGDEDCAPGFVCVDDGVQNSCLRRVETDAGTEDADAGAEGDAGGNVDAGTPDGGPTDAGTGDAGAGDAGTGDAGAGDAGAGDAGTGDAGTGDAGAGDAGTGDAGTGDAGTGDAGADDAGTNDAGFFCGPARASCPALIDFVPGLNSEPAPGAPFDRGVRLRVDPITPAAGGGDLIRWGAGAQIHDGFAARIDNAQGTIAVWLTPTFTVASLNRDVELFTVGGYTLRIQSNGAARITSPNTGNVTLQSAFDALAAGTTSLVVFRWDRNRPLSGGDHVVLDVDGAQFSGGVGGSPTPSATGQQVVGGALDGTDGFDGTVAGLTVWRRPLFDGAVGVDLGHGNELDALLGDADPAEVGGGPWDVVFALPTDQSLTRPIEPIGQAWAHPFTQNLLGAPGSYPPEDPTAGWTPAGAATVSALDAADAVFAGGVLIDTDSTDGLQRAFDVVEGDTLVLRVVAHSGDGVARTAAVFRSDADNALLALVLGTTTSTSWAPDELLLSYQVPAGITRLRAGVGDGAVTGGIVAVHHYSVLSNMLMNPSFENGSGSPYTPEGWIFEDASSPITSEETTTVHSLGSAVRIDGNTPSNFPHYRQAPPGQVDGNYYAAGGAFYWLSGAPAGVSVTNGSLFAHTRGLDSNSKMAVTAPANAGVWQLIGTVGRQLNNSAFNNHNDLVRWGSPNFNTTTELLVDDGWMYELNQVETGFGAADLQASSARNLLRVHQPDLATQALTLNPSADGVEVHLIPGGEQDVGYERGLCSLFGVHEGGSNHLRVSADGAQLRLTGRAANNDVDVTAGTAPSTGALHRFTMRWAANGDIVVSVDDVEQIRTPMPAPFGTAPTTMYIGQRFDGAGACELAVQLPGALVIGP